MSDSGECIRSVSAELARLTALCDTGFALAVHIRFTSPALLYRTYSQAWIEYYSAKGFMLQDPVVRWGLAHPGTIAWADLAADDPAGVIKAAVEHGLTNGWNYATGPASSRTLCGFTKSGAPFTTEMMDIGRAAVEQIHALTEAHKDFTEAEMADLRALLPG
jgi:LuxR family transcriptional regulator